MGNYRSEAKLTVQGDTCRGPTASPEPPSAAQPNPAVKIWQDKLVYLQRQEAISADAAQKFAISKQIEECQQKIVELGAN